MTVLSVNPSAQSEVESLVEMCRKTDKYFSRTAAISADNGDRSGLWAVYSRAETKVDTGAAVDFIVRMANAQGATAIVSRGQDSRISMPGARPSKDAVKIFLPLMDGDVAPAKQPVLYYTGPASVVSELETGILQRIVPAIESAKLPGYLARAEQAARDIVLAMPDVPIIEMSARHCPVGAHIEFAKAVARGNAQAKALMPTATGFIGTSTDEAAPLFGTPAGKGTMPHALINYAGSTLGAAQMFVAKYPEVPLVILPDFFGKEVSDTIEVARWFNQIAPGRRFAARLDTHGARYLEGLDEEKSKDVVYRHAPQLRGVELTPAESKHLFGKGVSVAAVFHMKEQLLQAGVTNVDIFVSSGFSAEKCKLFALADAPIAGIGTGSHVPEEMEPFFAKSETLGFAAEDGPGYTLRTKVGREWVLDTLRRDFAKNRWSL